MPVPPATLRQGPTTVTGPLPTEIVQRIVRQYYGRYRLCYEHGLRENATLGGTIAMRLVIDKSGAVTTATRDVGTDLPDAKVVACVATKFAELSFPPPAGGVQVIVVYRIILIPGD